MKPTSPSTSNLAVRPTLARRLVGYAAHVYTASGIVFAFLAAREIVSEPCDPRWVFGWLLAAVAIDATDGPLARRCQVHKSAPSIDGRTIDNLLDYLTFAFLPLLLIDRMGWLPPQFGWSAVVAMGASLLGFSHVNAKFDKEGFFRGFPSYWNIFAYYAGWISTTLSPWVTAVMLWTLIVLTVSPIRMLYPNRAPGKWRPAILFGGVLWAALLVATLPFYPRISAWIIGVSLLFPVYYSVASAICDRQLRTHPRADQVSCKDWPD